MTVTAHVDDVPVYLAHDGALVVEHPAAGPLRIVGPTAALVLWARRVEQQLPTVHHGALVAEHARKAHTHCPTCRRDVDGDRRYGADGTAVHTVCDTALIPTPETRAA